MVDLFNFKYADIFPFFLNHIMPLLICVICVLQHAPGVPKVLVGNRLHLAYKRQVSEISAETYAIKNDMAFFEVSPLCDFNVTESFAELSRLALKRNGICRSWGPNKGRRVHFLQFKCKFKFEA